MKSSIKHEILRTGFVIDILGIQPYYLSHDLSSFITVYGILPVYSPYHMVKYVVYDIEHDRTCESRPVHPLSWRLLALTLNITMSIGPEIHIAPIISSVLVVVRRGPFENFDSR